MMINGSTTPLLYERLKLYPANHYRDVIVKRAVANLEQKTMPEHKEFLRNDPLYAQADFEVVSALVPTFSGGLAVLPNNQLKLPHETRMGIWSEEVMRRIVSLASQHSAKSAHADDVGHAADPRHAWKADKTPTTRARR